MFFPLQVCSFPNHKVSFQALIAIELDEKKQVCCEYIGQKPTGTRDRLEIRIHKQGRQKIPFSALKRDQFASGYDSTIAGSSNELIDRYFAGNHLVEAHTALEQVGKELIALFCQFLGYSSHGELKYRLEQETETPGVLRLMRYAEEPPSGSQNSELAIDHTDIGLITLMPHSSAETLQILSKKFDWIDVEKGQPHDTLVVIVGEQLAYLSNYTFQAVRHRVIPSPQMDTHRYSMPFLMRAPADFQLAQTGTGKNRLAKDVLNHIFEMPKPLQRRMKSAKKIFKRFSMRQLEMKSGNLVSAGAISTPSDVNISFENWPLLLFFKEIPQQAEIELLRSLFVNCSKASPAGALASTIGHISSFQRIESKGWNLVVWPKEVLAFQASSKTRSWTLFLVPVSNPSDDVKAQLISSSEDLAYAVRSCVVIAGRDVLESVFDLNRFRLY